MGMSYRRAWLLVDALNIAFGEPLVAKQTGGRGGGGAVLADFGREVVQRYRRIERRAASAGRADLEALTAALWGRRDEDRVKLICRTGCRPLGATSRQNEPCSGEGSDPFRRFVCRSWTCTPRLSTRSDSSHRLKRSRVKPA